LITALKAWGPAVLWAAVLFLLSEMSGVPVRLDLPFLDKAAHLVLFGILGASLAWGRTRGRASPPHGLLLALGVAWGALDEWHQSFVPGRTPDPWDLLMDVIGVFVGYGLVWWWLGRADRRAGDGGAGVDARAGGDDPSRPDGGPTRSMTRP